MFLYKSTYACLLYSTFAANQRLNDRFLKRKRKKLNKNLAETKKICLQGCHWLLMVMIMIRGKAQQYFPLLFEGCFLFKNECFGLSTYAAFYPFLLFCFCFQKQISNARSFCLTSYTNPKSKYSIPILLL